MSISSSNPSAINHYNIAFNLHNRQKDFQGSINHLNKAISLDSNYAKAYNNRGNSYWQLGFYDKAMVDYDKAIEVAPTFADAYNNKGIVLLNQGNINLGKEYINKAYELDPNDSDIIMSKRHCDTI